MRPFSYERPTTVAEALTMATEGGTYLAGGTNLVDHLRLGIRTADRLQRTATWVGDYEGGLEAIRAVVLNDSLGIAADLDAAMVTHVDGYEDEWAAALADPEKLRRFGSFVNAPDQHDPDLAYTSERGQVRPARPGEKADNNPVIARHLEVRK